MADDEERALMERESQLYYGGVAKSRERERMHKRKNAGYQMIRKKDEPAVRVLIGYLSQLRVYRNALVIDALAEAVASGAVVERACQIIEGKVHDPLAIVGILRSGGQA
ncbi:hypothetical protein PAPHI01_2065 [Pancytospora philotis]|nr:hypothetical protein PAPHI01_2065 [Pancytospora philotis]